MRRQVCWSEKLEDGAKLEIRVHVAVGKVRWQFRRSDAERWTYDAPASVEQWAELEAQMERRYQRRAAPFEDLELVRRCRQEAGR
jgi:hypothetical protein